MGLPKPKAPPYDVREWQKKPFPERLRMVCQSWAVQGYGTPWPIYVVYLLKVVFYLAVFCFFCSFTPGLGDPRRFLVWWEQPIAFQKAILWSIAFEGLGLGCGSGPLTGRYLPPIGGFLYFLRPGTTKAPLFPGAPIVGGDRRTWLDALLYAASYALLLRALIAPALTPAFFAPIIVMLIVLGITDKTLFLSARGEHYVPVLGCFLFPTEWLAGTKVVWMAVWLWAATSKLNHHFPSVVTVMQSNSPLTFRALREKLYRRFPDDLRPSPIAHLLGHMGTATEMTFPWVLLLSPGGTTTHVALLVMVGFHVFITSSVPMGVPIEWNFLMVYGGFFLFGAHAATSVRELASPALIAFLFVSCFLVQALGNLFPARISFLCAMRYYAGNWGYSVWLFRGDAARKMDTGLVTSAPRAPIQLAKLYDADTSVALLSKVMAFRAMHLHGRALHTLLARAVDDIDAYEYVDGELVAGFALGWNFGDGHLHDVRLLRAIQRQCHFEEGELRCVFVEAQPMGGRSLAYTIADARTGIRETGEIDVNSLRGLQPWPETTKAAISDG